MTEMRQVYRCPICGNIVEVVHTGKGELVCCGQAMQLQKENAADAAQDKHAPVISKTERGYKVAVGVEKHPMTAEHHIEWIEIVADGKVYRQELAVGGEPETEFCIVADKVEARAYCNLHGLWSVQA